MTAKHKVNTLSIIKRDYPLLNQEEFDKIITGLSCKSCRSDYLYMYVYKRNNRQGEEYIDLYAINPYSDTFHRYIIQKDCRMSEADEKEFESLCQETTMIMADENIKVLMDVMAEMCPVKSQYEYKESEINRLLMRLYYCSFSGTPRELLYKSNLDRIAFSLNSIEEYNVNGSSPDKILGVPYKLLKILEHNKMESRLFTINKRKEAVEIYKIFSSYFGKIPNESQWYYLEKYEEWADKRFNKKIYDRLGEVDHMYKWYCHGYKRYANLAYQLKDYNFPTIRKTPTPDQVFKVSNTLEALSDIIASKNEYDGEIHKRSMEENYEYCDDSFSIILPKTVNDIVNEAFEQENCLINSGYIQNHAKGFTTVLFLRKNEEINKPFVTVEVEGNNIVQAKGKHNKSISDEVRIFLDKYAKEKNFVPMDEDTDDIDDVFPGEDDWLPFIEYELNYEPLMRDNHSFETITIENLDEINIDPEKFYSLWRLHE